MARTRGTFGTVEKLAGGRYRARYVAPNGRRYAAPTTFGTKRDARAWLALRQADIVRQAWEPPEVATAQAKATLSFAEYAETWLAQRDLKARTAEHYRKLLDAHLLPKFGRLPLASISADDVRAWHARFGASRPTLRAHCYGLLRTIFATAVSDGKVAQSPCVIRGAGSSRRVHKIRPASLDELETIAAAMPERLRCMMLLGAWCAMRFGELTELRRRDIIIAGGEATVRVERAVVRAEGGFKITTPKSEAGQRDVAVPPHLIPVIEHHLTAYTGPGPDALLFPAVGGGHMAPAALYRHWYKARSAANRDDLRWHDLRHSGAVLAAATGATLAELMGRLGHSTPGAAMKYQHAAQGRDRQIAELLSGIATGRQDAP